MAILETMVELFVREGILYELLVYSGCFIWVNWVLLLMVTLTQTYRGLLDLESTYSEDRLLDVDMWAFTFWAS